jgi:sulfatase modifying factor 1
MAGYPLIRKSRAGGTIALFIALFGQAAQAQKGVVVDKGTGKPIAKAYVMHRPTWALVMTNDQGEFEFPAVLPGPVRKGRGRSQERLRVSAEGRLQVLGQSNLGSLRLVGMNGMTSILPPLGQNQYQLPPQRSGIYTVLLGQEMYRVVWLGGSGQVTRWVGEVSSTALSTPLARRAAGAESLIVSRYGYDAATLVVSTKDVGQVKLTPNSKAPPPGMRALKGGAFKMGTNLDAVASPIHDVTVSGFYVDTTEVTQPDYELMMGEKPWTRVNDRYDITFGPRYSALQMIWFEAALYCNKRSKRDGLDTVFTYTSVTPETTAGYFILDNLKVNLNANGYRLPTEAEWEYACKGGQDSMYFWGTNKDIQDSASIYGWHNHNTNDTGRTHSNNPVAAKKPNPYGLYDIVGNAIEYVLDSRVSPYPLSPNVNPFFEDGDKTPSRIARGGGFLFPSEDLSCSSRGSLYPYTYGTHSGFRVVLPIR